MVDLTQGDNFFTSSWSRLGFLSKRETDATLKHDGTVLSLNGALTVVVINGTKSSMLLWTKLVGMEFK